MLRHLFFAVAVILSCRLLAEDASSAPQPAKPPAVPMAVKALEHLKPQPNSGPTSWTNGPYTYDGSGNLTGIGREVYVYDAVGRLQSATQHGPDLSSMQTQSFTYDDYGNLTSTTKLGQTIPLTITPDANSNRLSGIRYDASGNVITADTLHYEYDAVGMLHTVKVGASDKPRIIYAYTADDERLFAFDVEANTTHWTVRGFDNKVLRIFRQNGSTWSVERDYVYRDGSLLAALKPGGAVEHYSLDHLGTARLVTDGAGRRIGYHVYWPFGEEWSPADAQEGNPLKFTGHERDADPNGGNASLDYMHARYHRSGWARFLSVDPELDVEKAVHEPQRWNRYSYVVNNPMRQADPNGRNPYDYVEGVGNGFSSSLLYNANRVEAPNGDYAVGQAVGDAAALAQSIREVGIGGTLLGAAGLGEVFTGGGATPVAVPVAAGGLLVAGHGATSAVTALNNLTSMMSKTRSVNQANQDIRKGNAPDGLTRVDKGKVKGEQDHAHLNVDGKNGALNKDGTWKHGLTKVTNQIRQYLEEMGWTIPK